MAVKKSSPSVQLQKCKTIG